MPKDRIDFTNPAELVHQGKRIPIATTGQYRAVKEEVRRRYETRVTEGELAHESMHFGKNELDQLVARVRQGLNEEEIYRETDKELHRRAPLQGA